jgi:hypothetical protein
MIQNEQNERNVFHQNQIIAQKAVLLRQQNHTRRGIAHTIAQDVRAPYGDVHFVCTSVRILVPKNLMESEQTCPDKTNIETRNSSNDKEKGEYANAPVISHIHQHRNHLFAEKLDACLVWEHVRNEPQDSLCSSD